MKSLEQIVIVGAARTPVGAYLGDLKTGISDTRLLQGKTMEDVYGSDGLSNLKSEIIN